MLFACSACNFHIHPRTRIYICILIHALPHCALCRWLRREVAHPSERKCDSTQSTLARHMMCPEMAIHAICDVFVYLLPFRSRRSDFAQIRIQKCPEALAAALQEYTAWIVVYDLM